MGTSASARIFVTSFSAGSHDCPQGLAIKSRRPSTQCPLLFHACTSGKSGLAPFARTFGLNSIAEIRRSRSGIRNCGDQFLLDLGYCRLRRSIWILYMQQLVEQAELGVVLNVIRHGKNLMTKAVKFLDRSKRDSRCRFLVHGVDHDTGVVESENAIGLVAVCQEAAGYSLTHDERDDWMAFHPGGGIRVCSRSRSKENTGGSLAPAVCLALPIHPGNEGCFLLATVTADHFEHPCCQSIVFLQSHVPTAGTRKASLCVRHHA